MARDRPLGAPDQTSPRDSTDADLDVIDLLAEDPVIGARPESEPAPARRGPRPPRWLFVGAAVAAVAVVAAVVVTTRDPDRPATVGLASPDDRAGEEPDSTATATTAPVPLPRLTAPALGDVTGQYALVLRERLVFFDPATGALERPRGMTDGDVTIIDANAGTVLVRAGGQLFLVGTNGDSVEIADDNAFPAVGDPQWWRVHDGTLVPTEHGDPVTLPRDTTAVAAVRDGFLLEHRGRGALLLWTPGGATRSIAEGGGVTPIAVHPDRVAWSGPCPGSNCGLHVTDVASNATSTVGGVMPLLATGWARGRFSADGRLLAVTVAADAQKPQEFVLIDLADGRVIARELSGFITRVANRDVLGALPVDFDANGGRVIVATTRPRALLRAFDTATGAAVATSENIGSVPSLASLDRTTVAATTPLFTVPAANQDGSGLTLATFERGASEVTIIDLDLGTQRVVSLPSAVAFDDSQWGSTIVALDGGFLVTDRRLATWVPLAGEPVPLVAADYIVRSTDRSEAWLVHSADNRSYRITRVDGTTGAVGEPVELHAAPTAAVGGRLLREIPSSFDRGAAIEVYDAATGRTRTLPVESSSPAILTAVGDDIVWFDQGCIDPEACGSFVTNLANGQTRPLPANIEPWSAVAGVANTVYVRDQSQQLAMIDLTTLSSQVVPDSRDAQQWLVSANGTVVFDTPTDGVLFWSPGRAAVGRLTLGNFPFEGVVALK